MPASCGPPLGCRGRRSCRVRCRSRTAAAASLTWTSQRAPAWCLPTQTCCQATQTTPLAPTRRETQSSPLRSPPTDRAGARRGPDEAVRRGGHVQRLMRPLAVVVARPTRPARPARPAATGNSCPVGNSARRVRWNRSIFPVVVGDRGAVSRCSMPFSRQIRSKSTSIGGCPNRPVNTLPLSVRICCGTPCRRIAAASPSQTGLGPLPRHQPRLTRRTGNDHRPRSAPSPSDPSASRTRPPRPSATAPSARRAPSASTTPAAGGGHRARSAPPGSTPDRPPTPTATAPHPRRASSSTIRRGPHAGCSRRSSSTAASTAAGI